LERNPKGGKVTVMCKARPGTIVMATASLPGKSNIELEILMLLLYEQNDTRCNTVWRVKANLIQRVESST
jgi:hypothetical protein